MNNQTNNMINFKGVIPPMVTPIACRNQLDISGLERLIEHILNGGVHGLFILGTTGEGPSLSYNLRREMIKRTCAQVNGRVPVLVSVTDTSQVESLSLAQYAAENGASAVVAAPPYYFSAGQPELAEYYERLAEESPLPLVLYNMPSCTKVEIALDTLRRLLGHRNVVAYKDSSGQMVYFNKVVRLLKEFPGKSVLVGPEEMLGEATLLGGHGGVSGGANLFPELYVKLFESAQRRDMPEVIRLHDLVMEVSSSLYGVGLYGSSIIKGIKCALSCMDVCGDAMVEPFQSFRERERAVIRQRVEMLSKQMPVAMAHAS